MVISTNCLLFILNQVIRFVRLGSHNLPSKLRMSICLTERWNKKCFSTETRREPKKTQEINYCLEGLCIRDKNRYLPTCVPVELFGLKPKKNKIFLEYFEVFSTLRFGWSVVDLNQPPPMISNYSIVIFSWTPDDFTFKYPLSQYTRLPAFLAVHDSESFYIIAGHVIIINTYYIIIWGTEIRRILQNFCCHCQTENENI